MCYLLGYAIGSQRFILFLDSGVADVPLKSTSDLLVTLTNLDIDEVSLQFAYDCLAVVQMFRRE